MCVLSPAAAPLTAHAVLHELLPLVPGLTAALDRGLNVFQPAAGDGEILRELAQQFPRSHFAGTEASGATVQLARAQAQAAGRPNLTFTAASRDARAHRPIFGLALVLDAAAAGLDTDAALAAVAAQLRPGATLILHTRDLAEFRLAWLPAQLHAAGFTHVRTFPPDDTMDAFRCVARR